MALFKKMLFLVGISAFVGGCSSHKAPDFPKTWKPINDLPEQVNEIPLFKQHVYQVTQLDTTVKGLLERWAEEAKMPLVYDHSSDFTLFRKVKNVRHSDLKTALAELSKLYSEQDMVFYIQNEIIMAHKKIGIAVKTNTETKKKSNKSN